jgi:hypothetical protein
MRFSDVESIFMEVVGGAMLKSCRYNRLGERV